LLAAVLDTNQEEVEKKGTTQKTRATIAERDTNEAESKSETAVCIDIVSQNGLNEMVNDIAKVLCLVSPDPIAADVKPGVIQITEHLKHAFEMKPQSKSFKIVSCFVQSDDQRVSIKSLVAWIVKPEEKLILNIRYSPTNIGRLDEQLSFCVRGIKEFYTIKCLANIAHPSFEKNTASIFQRVRKSRDADDIVCGEYITDIETYEFGSLVSGKAKDLKAPDRHKAMFTFTNDQETSMRVSLSLRTDIKNELFSLDAASFAINAKSTHTVTLWAFPKNVGLYEDVLVCAMSENPEPYLINLSCSGTKLDLEFDKKVLNFERNCLGAVEKREICIKNVTTIPLTWKFNLQDVNTDELQISCNEGTLQPNEKSIIYGTLPHV